MPESHAIIATIKTVFRNCRSFREYPEKSEGQDEHADFVNMVRSHS